MKSRTSSCKAAAFRKDLTRFWPVWALYILLHIFIQVILGTEDREYWYLANLVGLIPGMAVVNCGYGLLTALALFGDLFSPRMCNGLHSLPLKREHWFGAHVQAGLLFSLIPTAIMTLFMEAVMVKHTIIVNGWQLPLYWWAACNLQYIFFFGLAAFCAMCTGSRVASAVTYSGLNCLSLFAWLLVDAFYTPLLHGVVTQSRIFNLLSPVSWLTSIQLIQTDRIKTGQTYLDDFGVEQLVYTGEFTLNPAEWGYLGILVVIGILLLLAARQIYKRRHLECAGDFMAVKWLEPVFQVAFTVACAACVHGLFYTFFGYAYSNNYVMAALGLVAGWFAGRMFLERSTRVFRVRNIAGLALLIAAIALSLFITKLDPLGIEDWVPEEDDIKTVSLNLSHRATISTEDPAEIEKLLRVHQLALEDKITVHPDYDDYFYNQDQGENAAYISLTYQLKNGRISERRYYIKPNSEEGEIIRRLTSHIGVAMEGSREITIENGRRPMVIENAEDMKYAVQYANRVMLSGHTLAEEYQNEAFYLQLVDALQADADAGNLVPSGAYHPVSFADYGEEKGRIHRLYLDISGDAFSCYLNIYADCENTVALLESTGVLEEIRQEYITSLG